MKILIATGIYPPQIGGPAQYAKNLKEELSKLGHTVSVKTFGIEKYLPTGIRHIFYFIKILPHVFFSDLIITLDTFSVGLPAVLASRLLSKKVIIRTGGDFLWESYVERTGDLVLLRNFYTTRQGSLSRKEKIIFKLTCWTLQKTSALIFSTAWQKDIFIKPYELKKTKIHIIENFYGPKLPHEESIKRSFLAGTRPLKWKNHDLLKKAFMKAKLKNPDLILDDESSPYESFIDRMKKSYAVVLVSLGDISPNMVMDALRLSKPVILTEETGIKDRIKDAVLYVDPQNEIAITEAILTLSDPLLYREYEKKAQEFHFTHTWEEIAKEFIDVYKTLK